MWGKSPSNRSEAGSSLPLRRKSSTGSSKSKHKTRSDVGGSSSRTQNDEWEEEPGRRGSSRKSRVGSDDNQSLLRSSSNRKSRALSDSDQSPPRPSTSTKRQKASRTTTNKPDPSIYQDTGSESRRMSRSGPLPNNDLRSTVPNQFPNQAPLEWAVPFRPSPASQYGAAADFYKDQGQSVQYQPGVRPATPIVTGTQPHLMAALPVAAPPEETGNGSAAGFYSGTFAASGSVAPDQSDTSHKPSNQHRPQRPPRPSKPSTYHSSSHLPAAAAGAAGASAATYAYHQQHHTNDHEDIHSSSAKPSSRPSTQRPPAHPLPSHTYAPGTSAIYQEQRQQRGPIGSFVDWWNNYDDVRRMEDYTEYIGVCKYCFDPNSSVQDAPRKHRPVRRRSREFNHRVDKESRYGRPSSPSFSGSSDHERNGAGLVGAGLAGLGLAAATSSVKHDRSNGEEIARGGRRETRSTETYPDQRRRASDYIVQPSSPGHLSTADRAHLTRDNTSHSKRTAGGQAQILRPRSSSSSGSSSGSNGGIFSRLFSPKFRKDKKHKSRELSSDVYRMKQPARLIASDLAYHDDSALTRRKKTRRQSSSPMNAEKAVAGLGAAATLMAAADSRRQKGAKTQPELFAVREPRSPRHTARSNHITSRVDGAEEWEDVSDIESESESESSGSSGLAFGVNLSAASSSESRDSLDAEGRATRSLPYTLVRDTDRHSRPQSHPRSYPCLRSEIEMDQHAQSYTFAPQPTFPSSIRVPEHRRPLQSVDPIPIAGSRSSPLRDPSPPLRSRTQHLPLQQPQPVLPIRPASYDIESTIDDTSSRNRRLPSSEERDRRQRPGEEQPEATRRYSHSASARRSSRDGRSRQADAGEGVQEPARNSRKVSSPAEALPKIQQRRQGSGVLAGVAGVAAAGAAVAAASSQAERKAASPSPPRHRSSTPPVNNAGSSDSRQKRQKQASDRQRSADTQAYRQRSCPTVESRESIAGHTTKASASQQDTADGVPSENQIESSGSRHKERVNTNTGWPNVDDAVISEQAADHLRFQTETSGERRFSYNVADTVRDLGKADALDDSADNAVRHEFREAKVRDKVDELSSDEDIFDPNFFRKRHRPLESPAPALTETGRSFGASERESLAKANPDREGGSQSRAARARIPFINIIQPTPPQSVASSVRDPHSRSSSPLQQTSKPEDVQDTQEQPTKAKRRVTWGEDEFNFYQIESAGSTRDEYFASPQEEARQEVEKDAVSSGQEKASEPPSTTSPHHPPRVEPSGSPDPGITDTDPLIGNDVPVLVLIDDNAQRDHNRSTETASEAHDRSPRPSDSPETAVSGGTDPPHLLERDRSRCLIAETSMPGSFFEDNTTNSPDGDALESLTQPRSTFVDRETEDRDIGLRGPSEPRVDVEPSNLSKVLEDSKIESKMERKKKKKKRLAEANDFEQHDTNDMPALLSQETHNYDGYEGQAESTSNDKLSDRRSLTEWHATKESQKGDVGAGPSKKENSKSLWGLFRRSGSEERKDAKIAKRESLDGPKEGSPPSQRTKKSRRSKEVAESSDDHGTTRRRRSESISSDPRSSKRADKQNGRRPRSEPPLSDEDSGRRSQVPKLQVNISALGAGSTPSQITMIDPGQDPFPIERSIRGIEASYMEEPAPVRAPADIKASETASDEEVDLRMSQSIDSLAELERERRAEQSAASASKGFEPPESYNEVPEMIRLPSSRPQSPYSEPASPTTMAESETPLTKLSDRASKTSVPLRFRAPISSPHAPRDAPSSSPVGPSTAETSPTTPKRASRPTRPGSAEFRSSGEYRPLWLPSKYTAPPTTDLEDSLPSLPSSRTASEMDSDDKYESAVSSLRPSPLRQPSDKILDAWDDFGSNAWPRDEYLDSQQATPKAIAYTSQSMQDVHHFDLDDISDHHGTSLLYPPDSVTKAPHKATTASGIEEVKSTSRRASLPASTDSSLGKRRQKRSNSVAALAAVSVGAVGGAFMGKSRNGSAWTKISDGEIKESPAGIARQADLSEHSPGHPSQTGDDIPTVEAESGIANEVQRSSTETGALDDQPSTPELIKKDRPTPLEGLAMAEQPLSQYPPQSSRTETPPRTRSGYSDLQEKEVLTDASSSRAGESEIEVPLTARKSPDDRDPWAAEGDSDEVALPPQQATASAEDAEEVPPRDMEYQKLFSLPPRRNSVDAGGRALPGILPMTVAGSIADAQATPLSQDNDDELGDASAVETDIVQTTRGALSPSPVDDQLSHADTVYVHSIINKEPQNQGGSDNLSQTSENGVSSGAYSGDVAQQKLQRTAEDDANVFQELQPRKALVGVEQTGSTTTSLHGIGIGEKARIQAEDVPGISSTFVTSTEQAEPFDDGELRTMSKKDKKKQKKAKKTSAPSVGKSLATVEIDDGFAEGHTSRSIPIDVAQADPVHPEHGLDAQIMVPQSAQSIDEDKEAPSFNGTSDLPIAAAKSAQEGPDQGLAEPLSEDKEATNEQRVVDDYNANARTQVEVAETSKTEDAPTITRSQPEDGPAAKPLSKAERKKSKKKNKARQVFGWEDAATAAEERNATDTDDRVHRGDQQPEAGSSQSPGPLESLKTAAEHEGDSAVTENPATENAGQVVSSAQRDIEQVDNLSQVSVKPTLADGKTGPSEVVDEAPLDVEAHAESWENDQEPFRDAAEVDNNAGLRAMLNETAAPDLRSEAVHDAKEPETALQPEDLATVPAQESLEFAIPMSSKEKKKANKAKQKAQKAPESIPDVPAPEAAAPGTPPEGTETATDDSPQAPVTRAEVESSIHDADEEVFTPRSSSKKDKKKAKKDKKAKAGSTNASMSEEAALPSVPTEQERHPEQSFAGPDEDFQEPLLEGESVTEDRPMSKRDKKKGKKAKQLGISSPDIRPPEQEFPPIQSAQTDKAPDDLLDDIIGKRAEIESEPEELMLGKKERKKKAKTQKQQERLVSEVYKPPAKDSLGMDQADIIAAKPESPTVEEPIQPSPARGKLIEPVQADVASSDPFAKRQQTPESHATQDRDPSGVDFEPKDQPYTDYLREAAKIEDRSDIVASETPLDLASDQETGFNPAMPTSNSFETVTEQVQAAVREDMPVSSNTAGMQMSTDPEQISAHKPAEQEEATSQEEPAPAANDARSTSPAIFPKSDSAAGKLSSRQPAVVAVPDTLAERQSKLDQDLLSDVELPAHLDTVPARLKEHETPEERQATTTDLLGEQHQPEGKDIAAVDKDQQAPPDDDFWTPLPNSKSKKKAKKDKARQQESTTIEDEAPTAVIPGPEAYAAEATQDFPHEVTPTSKSKKKKGKKSKVLRFDDDFGETNPTDEPTSGVLQGIAPNQVSQQVSVELNEDTVEEAQAQSPSSYPGAGAFDGSDSAQRAMFDSREDDQQSSGSARTARDLHEHGSKRLSNSEVPQAFLAQEDLQLVESRAVLSPYDPSVPAEGVVYASSHETKPPTEDRQGNLSTAEGYVTVADLDEQRDAQGVSVSPVLIEATPAEAVEAPVLMATAPDKSASDDEERDTPQKAISRSKKLTKKQKRKAKKGKPIADSVFEEDVDNFEAVDPAMADVSEANDRRLQAHGLEQDRSPESQPFDASTAAEGEIARAVYPLTTMAPDTRPSSGEVQDVAQSNARQVAASPAPRLEKIQKQQECSPKSQRSQSPSQLWGSNSQIEEVSEREPSFRTSRRTEDVDFAATLAAGLQDSGFDPELVTTPDYHKRAGSASPKVPSQTLPRDGEAVTGPTQIPRWTWSFSKLDDGENQERDTSSDGLATNEHTQARDSELDDAIAHGLKDSGFASEHATQWPVDDATTPVQHDRNMAYDNDEPVSYNTDGGFAASAGVTGASALTQDYGSSASKRAKKKAKKKKQQQQQLVEEDDGPIGSLSSHRESDNNNDDPPSEQPPQDTSSNGRAVTEQGRNKPAENPHTARFHQHEPIRDSGYQGSIPGDYEHDRGWPSPSTVAVPAKRASSDVESTSKERNSALFRSPPAPPLKYDERSPRASPTHDAHLTTPGLQELEEGRGVDPLETEEEYRASYGSELEPIQEDSTKDVADEEDNVGISPVSRAVSASNQPILDVSPDIPRSSYVSPSTSEIANTRRHYRRSSSIESKEPLRPSSVLSARARTPASVVSQRSVTPTLHRSNPSSDLGMEYKRGSGLAPSQPHSSEFDFDTTSLANGSRKRRQSYDPLKGSGKDRQLMSSDQGIYEGYGDVHETPRSPSRPQSLRKRQSMQIIDLENRLEQAVADNDSLRQSRSLSSNLQAHESRFADTLRARDEQLHERDVEINSIRTSLSTLQQEVARLSEHNAQLSAAHAQFSNTADERYAVLEAERDHAHSQWQARSRELDELRDEHGALRGGMEAAVGKEISAALSDKNAEIRSLRAQLDSATQEIRSLQQQILASKTGESFLNYRDEAYFESACQQLCQHVQAWVLRFSKFSDMRFCRSLSEVHDDKIETRLDNAILDGTDVDQMLADRVLRRDVFMSVVMTLIWEFVFTRYLFGMDREQRQKLKNLEKILSEVGPQSAVAQWRATTLILLSRRPAFAEQRFQDTEAVVHEIYGTLAAVLRPPQNLIGQIQESLRNVMRLAVGLSIDMRTQRPEYMMLPPLRPEYNANGDLAKKVYFNAGLMNERSGEFKDNEEPEDKNATVRLVLFPLVVRRGDDKGEGTEEIVISPAQVHVSREITKRDKRGLMVGGHGNKSTTSVAAPSVLSGGDMV